MSPYGSSKLMTEIMLRDAGSAHGLRHVILRYFNVAGADPHGRTGQSTQGRHPSHQGRGRDRARPAAKMDVFGTDYPTARRHLHPRLHPCQRSGARASRRACAICARGGASVDVQLRLWPRLFGARGDRHGEARLRRRFRGAMSPAPAPATPHRSSRHRNARARCSAGSRNSTISTGSSRTRWPGSAS